MPPKTTKLALDKAFDGGQAAQANGHPEEGNPFDPNTQADEFDSWMDGFTAELADKWTATGGQAHSLEVSQ